MKFGIIIGCAYLLIGDMTSKFIIGFIVGIYASTKYDIEPYVILIEDKINILRKELNYKEINKKSTSLVRHSLKFNWPWRS